MESIVDPKFAPYLQDNELPSDDIVSELKQFLEEPQEEYQRAEKDALLLSLVLGRVLMRRDALKKNLEAYRPILSPIRRLPPDILGEIFYHSLATHRNPSMHASEAPLLLTRVCRSWKAVAVSTPKLWSRLYIPFPYHFRRRFENLGADEIDIDEREHIFNLRLEALDVWLDRSGAHPLSLSMKCSDTKLPHESPNFSQIQKPGEYALKILSVTAKHSPRWQDIELHMPMDVLEHFQGLVNVDQLPLLTKFRAIFEERLDDDKADIKWLLTPSLQYLSLKADFHPWQSFATSVHWCSLTYLCLHSPISPRLAADILVQCEQLEDCSLSLLRLWYRRQSDEDTITVDNIHLPKLKSLMIDGDGLYGRLYLCNRIVAPELENIFYYSSQPSPTRRRRSSDSSAQSASRERDSESPLSPLQTLLNRSKSVKKLSFNPRGLSDTEVQQVLQAASSVETLLIDYYGWKGRPSHSASTWGDVFDLKMLLPSSFRTITPRHAAGEPIEGSSSSGISLPSDASSPTLLPHLISFKAWGVSALTDKTLLDFIASRTGIECTKNGCVRLERVLVTFNRLRQMDIVPQVRELENNGEPIQLDLYYTPEVPFYMKDTSARLGLGLDGYGIDTSWPYAEISAYTVL
ncbi:hypothetical protein BJ165DRAFT_1529684 [Panaeolus papilionaceus]|nr:hypothetical protein BJ165DRAFT_1529684 [Panaeolus papilionaceus]